MKNKIKKWLIYKLGGMLVSDLPIKIQQELLNHWSNKAIDIQVSRVFIGGFKNGEFYGKSLVE